MRAQIDGGNGDLARRGRGDLFERDIVPPDRTLRRIVQVKLNHRGGGPLRSLRVHGQTGPRAVTVSLVNVIRLARASRPSALLQARMRKTLPAEFPGVTFYFLPADIVTQILNFGLPAPVDIQIDGADLEGNRAVADRILTELRRVPGVTDARMQQNFDYPKFHISVDRTKAAEGGYTPRDVASSLLVSLSGSFQVTPTFFLNWQNGVNYNLVEQTPQYAIQSLQDLQNIPDQLTNRGPA